MAIAGRRRAPGGFAGVILFLAALVVSGAQEPSSVSAAETFRKVCGVCHTPESALATRRTRAQWQETMDKMAAFGAKATNEESAAILNYLTTEYGPAPPTAAAGAPAGGRRGGRGAAPAPRTSGFSAGPDNKH